MLDIEKDAKEWLSNEIDNLTDEIVHQRPVDFIEEHRYLKRGQTILPGPFRFDVTPYWEKPFNQIDPYDPTREIWVKKGVKTSLTTTMFENAAIYFAAHVKSTPMGYISADKELATTRLNTKFVPAFQQSGFKDIFQSSDESSGSKTGKTKSLLEFIGLSSLQAEGARNPDKMRDYLWLVELLDELDTYALNLLGEGDPIRLLLSRCDANWDFRKVIGGSTPLLKGSSQIQRQFERGNQQVYKCRCLKCGYAMPIDWHHPDINNPSVIRGMQWDYLEGTNYHDPASVRYECWNCGNPHMETDKPLFINKDNSEWVETAQPVAPHIESYHVPGTLSRFKKWTDHVTMWHEAFHRNHKVRSDNALQVLVNNVFGDVFEVIGKAIPDKAALGHRREFYHSQQILNEEIEKYNESGVLFLIMTIDVQLHFLSIAVWGVTVSNSVWLIEYKTLKDDSEDGCLNIDSAAWCELRNMIDEHVWISDDEKEYHPMFTAIDCSWGDSEAVVVDFCSEWTEGVYAIKGDAHSYKRITSFYEYKTSMKSNAYMIAVDHYKDRLAPVLRRRWVPEDGNQPKYHFNVPVDISNKALKELTVEFKRPKKNKNGESATEWYRPPGTRNELWDLLVYAHASIDIFARIVCTQNLELNETDWYAFWEYAKEGNFYLTG